MIPTTYLRFVERAGPAIELGPGLKKLYRILQQWHAPHHLKNLPPDSVMAVGEWRDVPTERQA